MIYSATHVSLFLSFSVGLDRQASRVTEQPAHSLRLLFASHDSATRQEDNMYRLISRLVLSFTLLFLFSASAFAQTSHSVWSDKPFLIKDGANKKEYKDIKPGDAIFAWTQATARAYAHAHGVISATLNYDFMLVSTT